MIPDPTYRNFVKEFSIDDLLSGGYRNDLKTKLNVNQLSNKDIALLIDDTVNNRLLIESEEQIHALFKEYEERLISYYTDDLLDYENKFMINFERYVERESIDFDLPWFDKLKEIKKEWLQFEFLSDEATIKMLESTFSNSSEEQIIKLLDEDWGINKKSLSKFEKIYSKLKNKKNIDKGKQKFLDFMDKFYYGIKPIKPPINSIPRENTNPDKYLNEHQKQRYKKLLEAKSRRTPELWKKYVNSRIRDYGVNPQEELEILEATLNDTKIKSVTSDTIDFSQRGWWGSPKIVNGKNVGEIEEFYVYSFEEENYKIYISKDLKNTYLTPTNIRKIVNSQGKIHKDSTQRLIFSNQKASVQKRGGYSANKVTVMFKADTYKNYDEDDMIYECGEFISTKKAQYLRCIHTIRHEGGHSIDKAFAQYLFSSDPEYIRRVNLDHANILSNGGLKSVRPKGFQNHKDSYGIWITEYARTKRYFGKPDLVENWAEQVDAYLSNKEWFQENYPNSYEYIDNLFKIYERDGNIDNFIRLYNIENHRGVGISLYPMKFFNDDDAFEDYMFKLDDLYNGQYLIYLTQQWELYR